MSFLRPKSKAHTEAGRRQEGGNATDLCFDDEAGLSETALEHQPRTADSSRPSRSRRFGIRDKREE